MALGAGGLMLLAYLLVDPGPTHTSMPVPLVSGEEQAAPVTAGNESQVSPNPPSTQPDAGATPVQPPSADAAAAARMKAQRQAALIAQAEAQAQEKAEAQARQSQVRIRSVNFPGRYVQLRSNEAFIDPLPQAGGRPETRLEMVQGLADASAVSFRVQGLPNAFLRHSHFKLVLEQMDGSSLFTQDASFRMEPGLAGQGYSFQSVNRPGYYLRHSATASFCNSTTTPPLFRADASFFVERLVR